MRQKKRNTTEKETDPLSLSVHLSVFLTELVTDFYASGNSYACALQPRGSEVMSVILFCRLLSWLKSELSVDLLQRDE